MALSLEFLGKRNIRIIPNKIICIILLLFFACGWKVNGMETYGHYVNQGVVLFNQGNYEESVLSYRRAISIKPEYPHAYNNLGNSLFKLDRLKEAEETLRKAINLNANFAEAWSNLGMVLECRKKFDEAIECYKKSISIKPSAPSYLGLGNAYSGKGLKIDAIRAYKMAISLDETYWKAHFNLGNEFILQKKYDEAMESYQNTLALKTNDPSAYVGSYVGIGVAYGKKGNNNEAKKYYEKAITLDPNDSRARYNMANLLWEFGELDQAENQFRYAIKLDPTVSCSYSSLANLLAEQERNEEAIKVLEDALKAGVNTSTIYNNIGNSYFRVKRYEDAFSSYKKAIDLKPDNYTAHYNLGNFKAGSAFLNFEKSIEHFNKALKGQKFVPAIHNNIAFAYAKIGNFDLAKKHYKLALKSDPKYEKALLNLNLLKSVGKNISQKAQKILCFILGIALIFVSILVYVGKLSGSNYVKALLGILFLLIFVVFFNQLKRIKVYDLELDKDQSTTTIDQVQYDFFASEVKLVQIDDSVK